jgi:dihydroflavonol-4-reductase
MAELATIVEQVSGTPKPRITMPMWMAKMWSPVGDGLSRRSGSALTFTSESLHALQHCPPITGEKAHQQLGHEPRPIEDTVADIYDWFDRQGV